MTTVGPLSIVGASSLKRKVGMFRLFLAAFALLTLTLVSAVSAHEHGTRHPAFRSIETPRPGPTALPATIQVEGHTVVWLAAPDTGACADTARDTCHNHSKATDCTCPAACAGLFNIAATVVSSCSETSADMPYGARRLLATSAAPPTPPPRG